MVLKLGLFFAIRVPYAYCSIEKGFEVTTIGLVRDPYIVAFQS